MNWIVNMLVAVDQLGNAIAGGEPDTTISARIGQQANRAGAHWFWRLMQGIVNFTFEPIDGPGHCMQAYMNDPNERIIHGNLGALIALCVFVVLACIPLAVIIRLIAVGIRVCRR